MDTRPIIPNAPSVSTRQYLLRTIAAAFVALVISLAVQLLGRSLSWRYSESIGFASFLFCIPVLMPVFHRERARSWASRLSLGFIFAFVGGLIHAFFIAK